MINHDYYMALAIKHAKRAIGISKPNPAVGCVIVAQDKVVGSGHTQEAGASHAEPMALRYAGANAQGATVYVTLEPCAHHGHTPPCVDALIAAGVARVVFGCLDPNPLVQGRGQQLLQEAGIDVIDMSNSDVGQQCQGLNLGFMHKMVTGRPYVFSKLALSLDGRTAMASGESQWITGEQSRGYVHYMRAQSCAVLTGVGTVLADDPALTCRPHELAQAGVSETLLARIIQPVRVVLDSHLRTPITAKLLSQTGKTIIFTKVSDTRLVQPFTEHDGDVEVVSLTARQSPHDALTESHINLQQVMDHLGRLGMQQIMVEAGATLNASMLTENRLNEIAAFVAPKLLGATARPVFDFSIDRMADAYGFDSVSVELCGTDILWRMRNNVPL